MRFIFISFLSISFYVQAQVVEIPVEYFVNNQIGTKQKASYTGSPYLFESYKPATVIYKDKKYDVNIRLNVFKQQFEILQDGKIRVLNSYSNMKVILEDYAFICKTINNKTIPVITLVNGVTSLYKFFTSNYTPSKPSTSGYDKPRLANYSLETQYVLEFTEDEIISFKLNKDNVQRIFSNNTAAFAYIKKNKLRFRKESELVRLLQELNLN